MNPPVSPDHPSIPKADASHPYRAQHKLLEKFPQQISLKLDENDIRTLHRLLVVEKYRLQNVPIVSLDVGTLQHIIELQDKVDSIYPHGEKIPE